MLSIFLLEWHTVKILEIVSFKVFVLQKAQEEHKQLLKGGPFKLNLYPQEYFDMNPYFNDKPLPPVKKPPPEKPIAPPFKPSSPAKKVSLSYSYRRQKINIQIFPVKRFAYGTEDRGKCLVLLFISYILSIGYEISYFIFLLFISYPLYFVVWAEPATVRVTDASPYFSSKRERDLWV